MRLRQAMLLGIGGVRVCRALALSAVVWHANEGHSAFLTLERTRGLVQTGQISDEAAELVRKSTVFTTHTPFPAGHVVFPIPLIERHFSGYWEQLGLTRDAFLRLGEHPDPSRAGFNMTALAIRMSAHLNGVSREHGRVTRAVWSPLWPGSPQERVA